MRKNGSKSLSGYRKHLLGKKVEDTVFQATGENPSSQGQQDSNKTPNTERKRVKDTQFADTITREGLSKYVKAMEAIYQAVSTNQQLDKKDTETMKALLKRGYELEKGTISKQAMVQWFKEYNRVEATVTDKKLLEGANPTSRKAADEATRERTKFLEGLTDAFSEGIEKVEDKRRAFEDKAISRAEALGKAHNSAFKFGLMSLFGPAGYLVGALNQVTDTEKYFKNFFNRRALKKSEKYGEKLKSELEDQHGGRQQQEVEDVVELEEQPATKSDKSTKRGSSGSVGGGNYAHPHLMEELKRAGERLRENEDLEAGRVPVSKIIEELKESKKVLEEIRNQGKTNADLQEESNRKAEVTAEDAKHKLTGGKSGKGGTFGGLVGGLVSGLSFLLDKVWSGVNKVGDFFKTLLEGSAFVTLSGLLGKVGKFVAALASFAATPIGIALAGVIAAYESHKTLESQIDDAAARGDSKALDSLLHYLYADAENPNAISDEVIQAEIKERIKKAQADKEKQGAATSAYGVQSLSKMGLPKPGSQISDAILSAAKTVGIDPGLMMAIANTESKFDSNAKNPRSSASGLYQFTDKTWADMVRLYGSTYGIGIGDKNDPRANAIMAAQLIKNNQASLAASGIEATPENLYMSHFLGASGAKDFLKSVLSNPTGDAAAKYPDAAKSNPELFFNKDGSHRTFTQVYDKLSHGDNMVTSAKVAAYNAAYNGAPQATASTTPEVKYNRESAVAKEQAAPEASTPATTQAPVLMPTGSTLNLSAIPSFVSDEGLLILNTPGVFA
jgi:hypothetical protein